ncbi:MAG: TIGR03936 family radical SAM-associated protein [Clostridiales Family XIII bacterium]|jgi:radical SAM-linked protein|nr:TIGR03936 family radical SAM-associated protein [Clostridiales Family XIII bacterium]
MKTVIKFMKTGRAVYMSHLDLQRALLRGLRRSGLTPVYSSGFNPHPKMSLALPLTLGFESLCEYLEVAIEGDQVISVDELNRAMPEGVVVISVDADGDANAASRKSMASRVRYAEYDITAPQICDADRRLVEYLAQEHIYVEKENRKKGGTDTIDIRPLIISFTTERNVGSRACYACVLSASAGATLNPLALTQSFYEFCDLKLDPADPVITRTKIVTK